MSRRLERSSPCDHSRPSSITNGRRRSGNAPTNRRNQRTRISLRQRTLLTSPKRVSRGLSTPCKPDTPTSNSVQSSSLASVRLQRLNLYVVLRKLIPELQAFSKSIQETPMVRFYSSIYSDNKMLIRQMSCVSAFHGSPHQIAAADRTKTECLGSVPDRVQRSLVRVGNSLFLELCRDN